MPEKERIIWALTDRVLDLVNEWENITTSDIQGAVEAVIMDAYREGEMAGRRVPC